MAARILPDVASLSRRHKALNVYEVRDSSGATLFASLCLSEAVGFADGFDSPANRVHVVRRRFKSTGAEVIVTRNGGAA